MPRETRPGGRYSGRSFDGAALSRRNRSSGRGSQSQGSSRSRKTIIFMLPRLATRILRTTDKRLLWKFAWNFGVRGMLSVERFKRRIAKGEYYPPFLYLSIINSCNLRCQGCWVDVEEKDSIDLDTLNRTIA